MVLPSVAIRQFLYVFVQFVFTLPCHASFPSRRLEEDLRTTCHDNFDIQTDQIIRTQDSKAMGAKYINERDVQSRDECLRMCCETERCDVFVFEEKSPGSCYMFECGPPEDFKCKFTKHTNYTSAVLTINRHMTELETQIKFTQHEHELTKLREPVGIVRPSLSPVEEKTTSASKTKEVIEYGLDMPSTKHLPKKGCSRYQFECHKTGECIAIYNACDGVPQCSDGSDEAAELGCPAQQSTMEPVKPTAVVPVAHLGEINPDPSERHHTVEHPEPITSENIQKQWPQHQVYAQEGSPISNMNTFPSNNQGHGIPNEQNPRAGYGREGEGLANYRQDLQWNQYKPNGVSQIFTHKGNGLVPQTDRYTAQHPYASQDIPIRNGGQYNEPAQNEYQSRYYYDGSPYKNYPQNPGPNNWQQAHRPHDLNMNSPVDDGNMARPDSALERPNIPSDYYYEESYRNKPGQQVQGHQQGYPVQRTFPSQDNHVPTQAKEPVQPNDEHVKTNSGTEKSDTSTSKPTTSTEKPKEKEPKSSHRKVEKLSAEAKSIVNVIDIEENDDHKMTPSGAILSLTMGLCITTIMVVLVGCRMRMVKTKMRRGGKSSYAHDADFLVNGMYL